MTVYIDSSVQNMPAGSGGAGTAPADQVQAAATIWNNCFSTNEGNTTNFTVSVVSSASQANVIVNAVYLSATEPNAGASQPNHSGKITSQTITINTKAVLSGTNTPLFNPGGGGYQSIFVKIMLHEFGHVFGMADVQENCSTQAYSSVMDQICGAMIASMESP